MALRDYQLDLKARAYEAWAGGARNVMMRLDTGGGKTEILSDVALEHTGASAIIAHRHELVSQLSLALARKGLAHNLIAAQDVRRAIAADHIARVGRSFYDPGARAAVASVDTLIRAPKGPAGAALTAWAAQVTLWIPDEAHHVVLDNKWHGAFELFTNPALRGLLPTATPSRADGKGLGRAPYGDGVADVLIEGPPMRWLIEQGYLTDYRVLVIESDLARMGQEVGASGDWSSAQLRDAARRSHIVGDVVGEYLKHARGKLGVTFCTDVETAGEVAKGYRAAGVRAECLTGDTDTGVRRQVLRMLEARQIDVLVAVDIVSEGFDLPALEVGSFARPTQSLATYMQQLGRLLRPMYAPGYDLSTQAGRLAAIAASSKPQALLIDHVNNFLRHGPPDRPRPWTLNRRDKRKRGEKSQILLRVCVECAQPFERFLLECPHCGEPIPPPAARSSPEQVEGDLVELDPVTLAKLRGEIVLAHRSVEEHRHALTAANVPRIGVMSQVKLHAARLDALAALREAMERWGGVQRSRGLKDREMQKLFWLLFGVDVYSAEALGRADAEELTARIAAALPPAVAA